MDPNVVLPALSSLVSFVFAALVLAQWAARRRAFQLVWAIGLLWYGISAGTEFLGSAFGWNEPLYRAWYLFGGYFVAAYMGMGTVYLLAKTRFGYFAAATIFAGGLFAILAQQRLIREGHPADASALWTVVGVASVTAIAVAYATARHREASGHVAMAALALGSIVAAYAMMTAPIAAPGYAVDASTGVPIGSAIPSNVRLGPTTFNIAGAFTLVFGALFSAYVFMPKWKVLRPRVRLPVVAQLLGALAVAVNLIVSLPLAARALVRGELHSRVPATLLIAVGGFIPGVTSGLARFGITWAFFLGELVGVVLIFLGFLVSTEVFAARVRVGRWTLRREAGAAS